MHTRRVLRDLASRQSNRRPSGRFAEASTDALNQLYLVGLILSQMVKQENTLLFQPVCYRMYSVVCGFTRWIQIVA